MFYGATRPKEPGDEASRKTLQTMSLSLKIIWGDQQGIQFTRAPDHMNKQAERQLTLIALLLSASCSMLLEQF